METYNKIFIDELTQLIKEHGIIVDTINYSDERSDIIFKNTNGDIVLKMETPFDFKDLMTEHLSEDNPFDIGLIDDIDYKDVYKLNELTIGHTCEIQGLDITCDIYKGKDYHCNGCIFNHYSNICNAIICYKNGKNTVYTIAK